VKNRDELDITRLWQTYVLSKEQEIQHLKKHIEELSAGPEDSNVVIPGHDEPDRPLGKPHAVHFVFGDRYFDAFSVGRGKQLVSRDPVVYEHYLRVQSLGKPIRIEPSASNSIYIFLKD
jgi:hypothetical protein